MEPARLGLALGCLSLPPNDVFPQHLARLLAGPVHRDAWLAVTSRLDHASGRVLGPRAPVLAGLRTILDQHDQALAQAPADDPLGAWVEMGPEGADAGWWRPGPLSLDDALAAAPDTEARARLATWAGDAGVGEGARVGRSFGAGNPFTGLSLALPGDSVRDQLDAGLSACAALGLAPPDMALLAPLVVEPPERLRFAIDLTGNGVARLGFEADKPSTALLLSALDVLEGVPLDRWALLEAALEVEAPERLWLGVTADGDELEAEYALA